MYTSRVSLKTIFVPANDRDIKLYGGYNTRDKLFDVALFIFARTSFTDTKKPPCIAILHIYLSIYLSTSY